MVARRRQATFAGPDFNFPSFVACRDKLSARTQALRAATRSTTTTPTYSGSKRKGRSHLCAFSFLLSISSAIPTAGGACFLWRGSHVCTILHAFDKERSRMAARTLRCVSSVKQLPAAADSRCSCLSSLRFTAAFEAQQRGATPAGARKLYGWVCGGDATMVCLENTKNAYVTAARNEEMEASAVNRGSCVNQTSPLPLSGMFRKPSGRLISEVQQECRWPDQP